MQQYIIERSLKGKDNAYLMDGLFTSRSQALETAELLLSVGIEDICYTVLSVKDRIIDVNPVATMVRK